MTVGVLSNSATTGEGATNFAVTPERQRVDGCWRSGPNPVTRRSTLAAPMG